MYSYDAVGRVVSVKQGVANPDTPCVPMGETSYVYQVETATPLLRNGQTTPAPTE